MLASVTEPAAIAKTHAPVTPLNIPTAWTLIVTATLPHAQLSARQPRRDCGWRQQHRVVEVLPVLRQQRAELARASVL